MPNAQLSKEGSSSKRTAEASLEYPAFTEREPTILQSSSSLILLYAESRESVNLLPGWPNTSPEGQVPGCLGPLLSSLVV